MKWRTFKFVFKFTTFVNGLSISDILALSLVNQLPVNRCLPKFKKKSSYLSIWGITESLFKHGRCTLHLFSSLFPTIWSFDFPRRLL